MATAKTTHHPLAGNTMTGADMVVQVLADEGVDTIFGYSGGAILPTYDAVFRYNTLNPQQPINLIVPANEQGAGFMAQGYSRASKKVGVALVTSGPGATNTVTPVRDAMADSIPMVVICGQVPRAAVGTDAFQEAPVFSIMSACAKHVFLVKNEHELELTMRTAFHIARTGRPGPVVVDIPKDVQNYTGTFLGEGLLPYKAYFDRIEKMQGERIDAIQAKRFFELLQQSKRPLLYIGGGAIHAGASEALRSFCARYNVPAVTTLMGIGALDTTDPHCLHMLGMHGMAFANYAVDDCDLLIAVGARFDDRVAGKPKEFAKNARVIHIDIDAAEIGKVKPVVWSHRGDARVAMEDLLEFGGDVRTDIGDWMVHVSNLREKHVLNFKRDAEIIQPQLVIEVLNQITKGEAIVSTGVGQHQMFAAQYFDFKQPRTWLTSGSMGTMGFGLPAAIGAQLANPGKLVINVDGDGSLRMNWGELETCTNYDIPVKTLLLNNNGDGMVVQWQTLYFEGRFCGTDKTLHSKDFVKAVEADGFRFARRVEKESDLRAALEAFVAFDGPAFLEVMVDKNAFVYPMVGPGCSYAEMITGPYIASREAMAREEKLETADLF